MNGKYTLANLYYMLKDTKKYCTIRLPEQIDVKYWSNPLTHLSYNSLASVVKLRKNPLFPSNYSLNSAYKCDDPHMLFTLKWWNVKVNIVQTLNSYYHLKKLARNNPHFQDNY